MLPLLLAACGPSERDASWRGDAPKAPADLAADAGYLKPPTLTASQGQPDGSILLTGQAEPGARIRLGAPMAEPLTASADAAGRWSFRLPPSTEVRLFGLSMSQGDRQVQSQGYLTILPGGRAVQLRSGASAFVYGAASDPPRLLTVDFDSDGAASVSGSARAGSGLSLRIDRVARGVGKTDSQGRFHLAVDRPLNAGALTFEMAGDSGEQSQVVVVSAAPELAAPFRALRAGSAWRIDWMTPGGGVQSTLILDPVS
ncbi:MAG: hypothetical protein EON95_01060 [Caulobacteraceae bacterium]|nr:MAG: hypothetical protein EON95_01060 [Caulobacteraceae bacterium]